MAGNQSDKKSERDVNRQFIEGKIHIAKKTLKEVEIL